MPLYEYTCQSCGKTFDALRSFKDADAGLHCPVCLSPDTKRQLSTFFSHTAGGSSAVASSGGGCGGCAGGSCGSCSQLIH